MPRSACGACVCAGWRFRGADGGCTRVPQALDERAAAAACGSGRAAAQAYPTLEAAGLLWVWPDASADAYVASAMRPPPLPTDLQARGCVRVGCRRGARLASSRAHGLPARVHAACRLACMRAHRLQV